MTRVIASREPAWLGMGTIRRPNGDVLPRWGFPEWFLISQTAIPALLLVPGSQIVRLPLRIAPFAISLVAFLWWLTKRADGIVPHPARPWLVGALAYLGLMIFHPTTNTLLAGFAQVMLYLSVLAPVFWAPALVHGHRHLVRLLGILLVCNGINASVGVLQVYDPDRWLPREFSRLVTDSEYGLDPLTYAGPTGERIIRPPGLFDNPGAVSGPGMFAGLLGLAFSLGPVGGWKKMISLVLAVAGMTAIYLSHVRTTILVLVGMVVVYIGMLFVQRQKTKAIALLSLAGFVGFSAFSFAVLLGGEGVADRFATLIGDDPLTVYYAGQRGPMLEHAFADLLIGYPLGAGLGRWGMIRSYFANPWDFDSPAIWAELQFPAWILDGGIVLLTLYSIALLVSAAHDARLVRLAGSPVFRFWATTVVVANAGILALVFGFTPFTTQIGLQYWFLAGALHGASRGRTRFRFSRRRKRRPRRGPCMGSGGVVPISSDEHLRIG